MTVSVGFKDPLRVRWALPSCIIQPLTLPHRLFVVVQFVFVTFQGLPFVLTPISWREVYSVQPCGYQYVAYGVGDIVSFSLLPSSSWRCDAHRSCSAVFPPTIAMTGIRPFYALYTFSTVADTHSSAAVANDAMAGAYQFDMSTRHHPNGEYIPRIPVS